MAEPASPGEFQRRIIRILNYEDGLWDISLGLVFLALGIYPLTRKLLGPAVNFILYLAFLAAVIIVQQYARRAISTPRIGVVRNLRTKARLIVLAVLIIFVFLTLALVITTLVSPQFPPQLAATAAQPKTDYTVDIAAGLAVIVIFSLMGFAFGIHRLHLYGILIGSGNLASTYLCNERGFSYNLPLVIAAAIIIMTGIVLLRRFVHKYPLPAEEVPYAGE